MSIAARASLRQKRLCACTHRTTADLHLAHLADRCAASIFAQHADLHAGERFALRTHQCDLLVLGQREHGELQPRDADLAGAFGHAVRREETWAEGIEGLRDQREWQRRAAT
eukprot:5914407-Prymnesium_polylepis.1